MPPRSWTRSMSVITTSRADHTVTLLRSDQVPSEASRQNRERWPFPVPSCQTMLVRLGHLCIISKYSESSLTCEDRWSSLMQGNIMGGWSQMRGNPSRPMWRRSRRVQSCQNVPRSRSFMNIKDKVRSLRFLNPRRVCQNPGPGPASMKFPISRRETVGCPRVNSLVPGQSWTRSTLSHSRLGNLQEIHSFGRATLASKTLTRWR
ncbi:hypothetical protein B0O80DRAFT_463734 [Mortierella sp. GBAus27b]|nr:hypothetical protein B0O80DRAFT_463734 [Mortierella sp. GBAus27b]